MTVVRSDVFVETGPLYSRRFPPTVRRIRFFISLWGLSSGTILAYVAVLWVGTYLGLGDEEKGVGPTVGVGIVALGTLAHFVTHRLLPFVAV